MILARDGLLRLAWPSNSTMGPMGYWLVFGSADGFGADLTYATRLVARKVNGWPSGFPGGWGHGAWGHGGWGQAYYGAGWGVGMWGQGGWGVGAFALEATSGPQIDGRWQVQVVGYDDVDNPSIVADRVQAQIQLAGTPEPCGVPTSGWTGGTLTMTFAVSTDDEG